jgi:hypothetical protein
MASALVSTRTGSSGPGAGCSDVALVRSRTADTIGTVGTFLAVALTVCIGRRRVSETNATITGAAAAPTSVPGPQIRATTKDAAADARLATISVCGEMPRREG